MKNKIAVFTDIHGNLESLEAIVEEIKKSDCDEIYCLGDVLALGPNSRECLDFIIKNKIKLILGNHELYYLRGTSIENMNDNNKKHQAWVKETLNKDHFDFLNSCPLLLEKTIGNQKICFTHFLVKDDTLLFPFESLNIVKDGSIKKLYLKYDDDIIVIGHDHNTYEINDEKKLICLGSSGLTKDDNTFYYEFYELNGKLIVDRKNVKYDRKKFEDKLSIVDYPDKDIIIKYFFGIDKNKLYDKSVNKFQLSKKKKY